MSILDFGLSVVGMPENEIADVKSGLPVLASILDEAKIEEPIFELARPHIEALVPLVKQAWPEIQKMWPQIVAETPLLQELVAFIQSKS